VKNKFIITGILAAAIGVVGLTGCESEKQEQAEMQAQAKITKEQAQQTALAKAPGGTIRKASWKKKKAN